MDVEHKCPQPPAKINMRHNFYNIVLSITAISRDLYNKVHTLTKRPLKESIDRDF